MLETPGTWRSWVDGQLDEVRAAGRWRQNRTFDAFGPEGELDGRAVTSYASNDYLGLSSHPAVLGAAHAALDRWGTGATASRLIVGTRPGHGDLESAIAEWKHAERALVFSSGYTANVGVLASLGGTDVTVFSDELNHASIIDGCRLGRSPVGVYRHNDTDHLGELLRSTTGRRVVVTDSVFSMDGDLADLAALAELCVRHDALLVLDEAHAVLGPDLPAVDGLDVIRVGTLSKTLGALGGWVAADSSWIDLLVNRARSFIFTTALAPADTAAAGAALEVLRSVEGDALVARLRELVGRVRLGHPSPIIPIVLGEEDRALKAAAALLEDGIFVPAIRPPTVAPGTSRLRVALSAAHTDPMVDQLVAALDRLGLHP
ncbi:MAG: aminotransferase class I/II-fold pyridoxal phosphate-dependent enzyme [Acidimicrobiales bacterium]